MRGQQPLHDRLLERQPAGEHLEEDDADGVEVAAAVHASGWDRAGITVAHIAKGNATGATINVMILAGLVIALGVLVDDAIIDIENIVRRIRQHRKEGSDRSTASVILEASVEVRGPIVHATMIILVSTIPVFLLSGLTGSFFRPLAFSYGLSILASLLVALTVIPALALIMLRNSPIERRESPLVRWLQRGYTALLARIVPRPVIAYSVVALVMVAGAVATLFGRETRGTKLA